MCAQLVDRLRPSSAPSVAGTVTLELVFMATTDAVQWVQIYGLMRLMDANDVHVFVIDLSIFLYIFFYEIIYRSAHKLLKTEML